MADDHNEPPAAGQQDSFFGVRLFDEIAIAAAARGVRRVVAGDAQPERPASISSQRKCNPSAIVRLPQRRPRERLLMHAAAAHCRTLNDPNTSSADKAQALKFLAHFIGDIHQPLPKCVDLVKMHGL